MAEKRIERQISFAAGELSPRLHGRIELAQYAAGARTLKNFIITPEGVATNRTGLQIVESALSTSGSSDETRRLLSFFIDDTVSAILVFKAGSKMRALLADTTYPRYAWALDQSITAGFDDPASMRESQVGDTMVITSSDKAPQLLIRRGAGDWIIVRVAFDVSEFPLRTQNTGITGIDDPRVAWRTDTHRSDTLTEDATHTAREWYWQVTYVLRDQDGLTYETLPYTITREHIVEDSNVADPGPFSNYLPETVNTLPASVVIASDRPITIWTAAVQGDLAAAARYGSLADYYATSQFFDNIVSSRIYRGREGQFGFIGETIGDTFDDDGREPEWQNPPPQGTNPFEVYEDGILQRTEIPRVVAHYEGRRVFAMTSERPGMIWCSAINKWADFDVIVAADDSDALSLELAASRKQVIRALIAGLRLVAMASGSEWEIAGSGQEEILTPNSIAAHPKTHKGCGELQVVETDEGVFFVQTRGRLPYLLNRDGSGRLSVHDISLVSRHLFKGRTIVDWAFAEEPYRLLWVVLDDGAVLSMCYAPEFELLAWSYHKFSAPTGWSVKAKNVAVAHEAEQDGVYFMVDQIPDGQGLSSAQVAALTYHHLGRLAYEEETDLRDAVYLDLSSTYNGRNTGDVTLALIGDGSIGTTVTLTLPAAITGAAYVGTVIRIDDPDGGAPLQLELTVDGGATWTAQVMNIAVPTGIIARISGFWICATGVGGLAHLEGQLVTVVADGYVFEAITVQAGKADLGEDNHFGIIHAGLGYDCDFESLDAAQGNGRQKTVIAAWMELEDARGGKVGNKLTDRADGAGMVALKDRSVSDGYKRLETTRRKVKVTTADRWAETGRVAYRQSDPMPVTLLGIGRLIKYGD